MVCKRWKRNSFAFGKFVNRRIERVIRKRQNLNDQTFYAYSHTYLTHYDK